jgi:hypothetical protein
MAVNKLYRFKVVVQVEHEGHKADFIFWDNECQTIVGQTAEEIREIMKKVFINTSFHLLSFPFLTLAYDFVFHVNILGW